LARQKALLTTRELQQRLSLADAQRELAEERARASEAVRDRDDALQIALKANGMGQWIWDLRQNTVHWSDQVFEIIGVERGSVNPVENSWRQYIHPADAEGMEKALEQTRSTGADYHNHYRIIAGDGSLRWIESRGKCQLDGDGRVARVVGVLADVTLRKQSEEAMLKAEKLAVAGRLAASVAHEINNPLEAVANLLYLISITDAAETSQKYAHQAMNELMRVSMITQQTLKFHRQTGSPKLTMLSETIEAVLALFRSKCMASQIDVDLIVEDERPVPCMASEMQQIFANLVTNSMEAMPRGGKLSIRVRPSRDWRDWRSEESRINGLAEGMRVTFCDSGVGMDRATLHRIFEPFFTTKAETGTGLGMWVVSQLVERHRGQVRVWSSSRLDHSGTAISIFLPFASQPETVGGPKLAATPEMQ
jgi:PAS domain S-box-containing protein